MKHVSTYCLSIMIAMVLVSTSASAQTGILKGRVFDKITKEGLPSVTIAVKGTYYGAASDIDGNYIISKINPGTYVVEIKLLGYKLIQYPAVKINAGETTVLDAPMEETSLTLGQEVVVVGEKPLFNICCTNKRV